ncbi:MAG: FAD-dependent oxidoreductase [Acidobacteriaceae bacterium]
MRVSFCGFLRNFAIAFVFLCLISRAFAETHRSTRETAPSTGSTSKLLLDVLKVRADGDPAQALVRPVPGPEETHTCDVVIIGGGMGGVSAALTAANSGLSVCLTEPTLWLGGQMTSEGVSAFDENKWIETTGATATYAELRHRIIKFYQTRYGKPSVKLVSGGSDGRFNPGNCWVSYLCFQPSAALEVLQSMLQPSIASGKLHIWLHTVPTSVQSDGRSIESVQAYDFSSQRWLRLNGHFFIDATEWGDLVRLAGLPFRVGAEARNETGEPNAPLVADPGAIQSFTYPFILLHTSHPVKSGVAPSYYEALKNRYRLTVDNGDGGVLTYGMFSSYPRTPGSFWTYRRSVDAAQFRPGAFSGDLSMINWDSNDYCDPRLLSTDPLAQARALQRGKRVSLGFAWWLQHDVKRDDGGGYGYPRLELQKRSMGSADGLAQQPYIRESRRIVAIRTIVEQDLAVQFQKGARARLYPDSVGIGQYPIDIHSCGRKDFTSASKPYEIPLGALIPKDSDNLLAASKDIGTTHITNGAYRLHPTEWAIGEAAAGAIVWSLDHHTTPNQIDSNPAELKGLQRWLVQHGQPIFWFDDVALKSPWFEAAQLTAAYAWLQADPTSLHFGANDSLSGEEIVTALTRANLDGALSRDAFSNLRKLSSPTWQDLATAGLKGTPRAGPIKRGDFALWLLRATHGA